MSFFENRILRQTLIYLPVIILVILVVKQILVNNSTTCMFYSECAPNLSVTTVFLFTLCVFSMTLRNATAAIYKRWFFVTLLCSIFIGWQTYLVWSYNIGYYRGENNFDSFIPAFFYILVSLIFIYAPNIIKRLTRKQIEVLAFSQGEKTYFLTKFNVFLNAIAGSFLFGIVLYGSSHVFNSCIYPETYGICNEFAERIVDMLLIPLAFFPLILFFSLATYFMKEEVFRAWIRFTSIFVPLLVITIVVSPSNDASSGWIMSSPSSSTFVSIIGTVLYTFVSILIIIWKLIKEAYVWAFKKP